MILLESIESDLGDIKILKTRERQSYVYEQGGYCQSEADGAGISLASYIHAMFGLLTQALPQKVLMIGCGGGSLGTMLAHLGVQVTIVDVNPTAFEIAHEYFSLPTDVTCHVADGRDFLLSDFHRYDAIAMDAYVGAAAPKHLQATSFFRLARSHLNEKSGLLVANVYAFHDLDESPDRIAGQMAKVWDHVGLLDMRGVPNRNAIVMAGSVQDLHRPRLLMPPAAGVDEILYDLDRWAFRPWRPLRSRR